MNSLRLLWLLAAYACSGWCADHGLIGTYYPHSDFTGTPHTRIDPSINFTWPMGASSPMPGVIPLENWSVIWTGMLTAPASDTYTFTTTSDDGIIVLIDGVQIVSDWTGHGPTIDQGSITLTAGPHAIEIRFYNGHFGATAVLSWESRTISRQVIPSQCFIATRPSAVIGTGTGMLCTYYASTDFTHPVHRRLETAIDDGWTGESTVTELNEEAFSVRWQGAVQPAYSDLYCFCFDANGRAEIDIDGSPIVKSMEAASQVPYVGTAYLVAGRRYDLDVRYIHQGPQARAHLAWSSALQPLEIIPTSQLYPWVSQPDELAAVITSPVRTRSAPAWIEGGVGAASVAIAAKVNGAQERVVRSAAHAWYIDGMSADAPSPGALVHPGANTVELISSRDGQQTTSTTTVWWDATDLAALPTSPGVLSLRAGDEILLTAGGQGRALTLTIEDVDGGASQTVLSGAPGQVFRQAFIKPGSFRVTARIDGGCAGTLPVHVTGVDLQGPIACQLEYTRKKSLQVTGAKEVALTANDAGSLVVDPPVASAENVLATRLRPRTGTSVELQARLLSAHGPILAVCPVDVFTLATDSARSMPVVDALPDGSLVCQSQLTMRPLITGLVAELSMYTAGSTFEDGSLALRIPTDQFVRRRDGSGSAMYRIIQGPRPGTYLCHSICTFQSGVQTSSY
jgi:hypothetical protein